MTRRQRNLGTIFGPRGYLSGHLHPYEHRPRQQEMAEAVLRCYTSGGILLAEAGTGAGKTLAYLAPALLAGRRLVVSTGTKHLQEQLFRKDLPLLAGFEQGITAVLLKGRGNYLCRRRLHATLARPALPSTPEGRFQGAVTSWAALSAEGDRAELDWLTDDDPHWPLVSAEHEGCPGMRCPGVKECFLFRARRRAAAADVVVVNHHLLILEAAGGGATFLPEDGALVVDEAHLLEETATRLLGVEVATGELNRFFSEAGTLLSGGTRKAPRRFRRGFELVDALSRALPPGEGSALLERAGDDLDAVLGELDLLIGQVATDAEQAGLQEGDGELLTRRATAFRESIAAIRGRILPDHIYWYERRAAGAMVAASPVDVAALLPRVLFDRFTATVLTSATLTVAGSFRYLRERLGIAEAEELQAESPFDYRRQTIFFVPRGMPDPADPGHSEAVARQSLPVLALTRGRAFILCTSRRAMRAVAAVLRETGGYRVLVQGEAPRSTLLADFLGGEQAVLVATAGFWQGVDVPGDDLSAVIVDRLPFASPEDPITAGRIAWIRERGGEPFRDYQLPSAVIMLKQGLGRLIRRASDRGILAVMDPRLLKRSYGKTFLRSLPDVEVIDEERHLAAAYSLLSDGEPDEGTGDAGDKG